VHFARVEFATGPVAPIGVMRAVVAVLALLSAAACEVGSDGARDSSVTSGRDAASADADAGQLADAAPNEDAESQADAEPQADAEAHADATPAFDAGTSTTVTLERISVGPGGADTRFPSGYPTISGDGRYVAFESNDRAYPGAGIYSDVYVRDRAMQTTELISVAVDAISDRDSASSRPILSTDGRYVAFTSFASNLIADDTNMFADAFLRDRQTQTTERISVSTTGEEGMQVSGSLGISADNRFVVFNSLANNLAPNGRLFGEQSDVLLRDRQTLETIRITPVPGHAGFANIAGDASIIVYGSDADGIDPGDMDGETDIFIYDRNTLDTTRVAYGFVTSVSHDGRYVVYESLYVLYRVDRILGTTSSVADVRNGGYAMAYPGENSISADGRFITFHTIAHLVPEDTDQKLDIYVIDSQTGAARLLTRALGGGEPNGNSIRPKISADGRWVVFQSDANNLVADDAMLTNIDWDVFVANNPLAP
jgi:Tol biopolymer transport system component